eukprot:Opistho-1_new@75466
MLRTGAFRLACVARASATAARPTVGAIAPSVIVSRRYAATAAASSGIKASSHWSAERVVSVGLLGLIPAAAIVPCTPIDMALAVALPLHGYWGLEQVFLDYIPNKTVYAITHNGLRVLTLATVVGLVYFNVHDVGITEGVKMLWSIR